MVCKVCGYESSENFSICPYCGEKNSNSSVTNETSSNSSNSVVNNNTSSPSIQIEPSVTIPPPSVTINRHINEIIDLKDVKIPVGMNRDVIDKNSTLGNFIINEPLGGEFFPNHLAFPIIIGGLLAWIPSTYIFDGILKFCHIYNGFFILIYWIFYFITIYLGVKFTSNKTKLTFSSSGIEAQSKKGKLFISREDIEDVYVKEIEGIQTSHGGKRGNIVHNHPYIQYDMIVKLKRPFDNSRNKSSEDNSSGDTLSRILNIFQKLSSPVSEDINEIKLLKEHYIRSWYFNSPVFKDVKTTKNLTYYIVQQIRKVFGL